MNFIKLTLSGGRNIYVSKNHIGHFFVVPQEGNDDKEQYTRVGVTTHDNGGFSVKETPEQIIKLINS